MKFPSVQLKAAVCSALLLALACANAAEEPKTFAPPAAQEGSIPMLQMISAVARTTGRKFVVDPRVQGNVLLPREASKLSYAEFLSVLQAYGFTAVTDGDLTRVTPEHIVRQLPVPLIAGKETRPQAEYVTKVVAVKSIPAPQLVPILRPLLPQQSHLVALPCINSLIIVDTFGNVRRLEELVQSLDRGEPYEPPKCQAWDPPAPK